MKTRSFTSILLLALMIVSSTLFTSTVANAQENAIFSVSPGSFTVTDVPPLGAPYTIQQNIVVWNRDTNARTVTITSEIPRQSEITLGYQPIPNENWVTPSPASILIPENSYAIIQIIIDIPRSESLMGKKWEVWIPVERQALPGEIGVLRPTVRMEIETTTTLPPAAKSTTSLTIYEENFALQAGKSKILTATLHYIETFPGGTLEGALSGENITWSATAGSIAPLLVHADILGQVPALYTAPNYETSVIISASYTGSDQYEPSSVNSYGTITVAKPAPSSRISTGIIIGIAIGIGCAVIAAAIVLVRRR